MSFNRNSSWCQANNSCYSSWCFSIHTLVDTQTHTPSFVCFFQNSLRAQNRVPIYRGHSIWLICTSPEIESSVFGRHSPPPLPELFTPCQWYAFGYYILMDKINKTSVCLFIYLVSNRSRIGVVPQKKPLCRSNTKNSLSRARTKDTQIRGRLHMKTD